MDPHYALAIRRERTMPRTVATTAMTSPAADAPRLHLVSLLAPDPRLAAVRAELSHDAHELIYLLAGRYRLRSAAAELTVQPGQLLLIPAGCEHHPDFSADGRTRFFVVQWRGAFPADPAAPCRVADANVRILSCLHWLRDLSPPADAAAVAQREHLLALLLGECASRLATGITREDPCERLRAYLEHNLDAPISARTIAQLTGLSPARARLRFRERYGTPPHQYLQGLRTAAAVRLLADTRLSLAEIAGKVGLASTDHLARLVRRATGRTPRQVRG